MGYSISVKFKNNEEKEKMKSFLIENKNILEKIQKTNPNFKYDFFSMEILDGEGLGYAPEVKNLLGFHGTGIPKYIWDLCAWMSVKAEAKSNKNNKNYLYYDHERMFITTDISDTKNIIVDERGIALKIEKESISMWEHFTGDKKTRNKTRELIIKLDEKWTALNSLNNDSNAVVNVSKKIKP